MLGILGSRPAPLEMGLVGESDGIRRVREQVRLLASSSAPVLITGERGTGKELTARLLHRGGPRRDRPFVALDCGALTGAQLEAELFGQQGNAGHAGNAERPAGSRGALPGLLRQAHKGTLFLAEVDEIPAGQRALLLRALETGNATPFGQDVRLILAGDFGGDDGAAGAAIPDEPLFRVIQDRIALPPLRVRGSDVLLLGRHFLAHDATGTPRVVGLDREVEAAMLTYGWPGNVGELRSMMERAGALGRAREVGLADLPNRIRARLGPLSFTVSAPTLAPLDEIERRYILHVLAAVGGSRGRAAQILRVDRKTLYRRLGRYGTSDA